MTFVLIIVGILFIFFGLVVLFGAPYVPSQKKYAIQAFEHFGIKKTDTLVDLGSGDGVILRIASRFGAKAVGYEINPILVFISKFLSVGDERVSVRLQSFWSVMLPDDVTIVYAFAVSRDGRKLTKLLQREANRLQRPLKLLCLGSPLKGIKIDETAEPYHLYVFHPLQVKNA